MAQNNRKNGMTYLEKKLEGCDQVFIRIIERSMKQIYINHAKQFGISESVLSILEKMDDSFLVAQTVTTLCGEPE